VVKSSPGFPRLAEGKEISLWIAHGLCEKRVRRRMAQGVGEYLLCTVDGSSTPST